MDDMFKLWNWEQNLFCGIELEYVLIISVEWLKETCLNERKMSQ